MRRIARGIAVCLLVAGPRAALAGLIPGLPNPLPPSREGRLHLGIENDFFDRGGPYDDHRTAQLSLDFRIGERWLLVVDQSILTEEGPRQDAPDPGLEGRLDEWSVTLARRFEGRAGRMMLGAGWRGTGEQNGEQVQNGFHRMFAARIVALPYLSGQTDAIGWLTLDREWTRAIGDRWRGGAWLSAAGEVSSGGRQDANIGGCGLLRTREVELRIGLRNEWREGAYDDVVRSNTAASERGLFATFALGAGPVDFEASERVDGKAEYGRLTLRAGPTAAAPDSLWSFAVESGLRLPRTAAHIDLAWTPPGERRMATGLAQTSLTLGYLWGESPADAGLDVFRSERQVSGGLEWRGTQRAGWVSPLADIGVGWRSEWLYGMLANAGTRSDAVDRAVITAGTGFEMKMGTLADLGPLSLRLSADGWLPLGEANVSFAGRSYRVQEPGAGLTLSIGFALRS